MVLDIFAVLQLFCIAVAFAILLATSISETVKRHRALAMSIVAAFALTGYLAVGTSKEQRLSSVLPFHFHDSFHYVIAGRHFHALGYQQIYTCTKKAMDELRVEDSTVPDIRQIRDLARRYFVADSANLACEAHFTEKDWGTFKADIATYLAVSNDEARWQGILQDNGNNPPPSWAVPAKLLAGWLPLSPVTLMILTSLDLLLLFVLLPLVMFRFRTGSVPDAVFGISLYIVLLTCTWFAAPGWTAGSYFRNIWLASLAGAVIAWRRNAEATSLTFIAFAAWLRVFPVLFLAAAWLAMKDMPTRLRGVVYTGIFSAAMAGLSLVMFGMDVWVTFFKNLMTHGSAPFINHLGYYQFVTQTFLVVFTEGELPKTIYAGLAHAMDSWYEVRATQHTIFRTLISALSLGLCWHAGRSGSPTRLSLAFLAGICLTYFWINIAHYYYVVIAIYVWLVAQQDNRAVHFQNAVNGAFLLLALVNALTATDVILLYQRTNALVMAWLLIQLATCTFEAVLAAMASRQRL